MAFAGLDDEQFNLIAQKLFLNSKDLARSPLPNLNFGKEKTISSSLHPLEYRQKLVYWSRFEPLVRETIDQLDLPEEILDIWNHPELVGPNNIHGREHVQCGDEISIVGRFNQHVGQVLSAVFQTLGWDIKFADFKTVKGKGKRKKKKMGKKVPDTILVTSNGTALVVGEAKTPWKHVFEEKMVEEDSFRHLIGQISKYLHIQKLKYGFLTTYEQTIFFKQEIHDGQWALYYSNIIDHATARSKSGSTKQADYCGIVTLRECFLFLASEIRDEYEAKNNMRLNHWAPQKRSSHLIVPRHISDDDNIQPPVPSAQPPLPTTNLPLQQHNTRSQVKNVVSGESKTRDTTTDEESESESDEQEEDEDDEEDEDENEDEDESEDDDEQGDEPEAKGGGKRISGDMATRTKSTNNRRGAR